jgi:hypothetical protein
VAWPPPLKSVQDSEAGAVARLWLCPQDT